MRPPWCRRSVRLAWARAGCGCWVRAARAAAGCGGEAESRRTQARRGRSARRTAPRHAAAQPPAPPPRRLGPPPGRRRARPAAASPRRGARRSSAGSALRRHRAPEPDAPRCRSAAGRASSPRRGAVRRVLGCAGRRVREQPAAGARIAAGSPVRKSQPAPAPCARRERRSACGVSRSGSVVDRVEEDVAAQPLAEQRAAPRARFAARGRRPRRARDMKWSTTVLPRTDRS